MGNYCDHYPNDNMTNTMDTVGAFSTGASIGGAIVGEAIGPHPLQLVAWSIAILSGLVAITLGCVRIYKIAKSGNDE
jgi:putative Mn2+ efflux pump MntP